VKILVVDDNPVILAGCQRVFRAEGVEVCLVASADQALATMDREVFGLLLVDVKMPGRDGMWLTREVKRRWPGIPVVLMSGYPVPETIRDGRRAGAALFLAKPFTPDELRRAVGEALKKEP
jgi:DNA-binding NtrC family response regulator